MKKPEEIVLTASLRVKNEEANLPRCLDNLARFCDHIVAYDDGSTDRTVEILRSHPKVRHVVVMDKGYYHESHDYGLAMALATLTNPDWIMRIDADEILDEMGVRRIRELLAIPGYKAWALKRFNCVGDEDHGDLAEIHWCLYRHEPGKVFFYNIRNHSPFPCLDKIDGKWGQANLRIRHFGYVDKDAELAKIKADGYHFGDYLMPYFTWEEADPQTPLLYFEVPRPWYFKTSQEQIANIDIDTAPDHCRYTEEAPLDLWLKMAWNFTANLAPTEARQALREARELADEQGDFASRCRLRFCEAVFAYVLADWEEADRAFAELMAAAQDRWPHLLMYARLYRERIAHWRTRELDDPRDPGLIDSEWLKDRYLPWFIEQLRLRRPEEVHVYGAGCHTMYLDEFGFFHHIPVKGVVDDAPDKKAVNRLPIMNLSEALRRGAQLLIVSTDAYEPQVMERLRNDGVAENMIQPIYWTCGDKPFWCGELEAR
ncbi:MAG TPA: glycosyltransferase family 2 protein [bacterium]|nr:glycosyltransferase family 2 protein [bacterium]